MSDTQEQPVVMDASSVGSPSPAAVAATATTPTAPSSLPSKPAAVSKAPRVPTSEYDFYIVLDFEATCDDNKPAAELLVTGVCTS